MLPSNPVGRLHERRAKQLGKFDERAVDVRREARWKDFLQRQDATRTVELTKLREEVLQSVFSSQSDVQGDSDDALPSTKHPLAVSFRQSRVWRKAQYFANQLVIPETLCSIPVGFSAEWLCYVRPEGSRGLLFCIDGVANLRVKSGLSFGSHFECGIPGRGFTVLEVVVVNRSAPIQEQSIVPVHGATVHDIPICSEGVPRENSITDERTAVKEQKPKGRRKRGKGKAGLGALQKVAFVYVVDVISWKNCDMTGSTAECRQWYLQARFDEIEDDVSQSTPRNRLPLRLAKFNDCFSDTLADLYSQTYPFETDSVVFVHREAFYIAGLNPLYLVFRDSTLSRWVVHRSSIEAAPEQQEACLTLAACPENEEEMMLMTADHYVLYRVGVTDLISAVGSEHAKSGSLVKISFQDVDSAQGCLTDVSFKGQPSVLRCDAESLGRIVSQHCARHRMSGVIPTFRQLICGEAVPLHGVFSNFASVRFGEDSDSGSCYEVDDTHTF